GDRIAVRVDLELVQRLGRERLASGGPRRVHDGGRMDVHDQDRLVRLTWLGKGIQIREVQARVSVREAEIGTGVMVRHDHSLLCSLRRRLKEARSAGTKIP